MPNNTRETTPSVDDTSVIDLEVVASLRELADASESGVDDVHRLVSLFLDDAGERVESLHSALAAGDTTAVAALAHSLKGSSMNLGASRLGSRCAIIESAARAGDIHDIGDLVVTLPAVLAEAGGALRTLFPVAAAAPASHAGQRLAHELQQLEDEFKQTEHSAPLGFWWWDATDDSITLSSEVSSLFGIGDSRIVAPTAEVRAHLHPDDQVLCDTMVSDATMRGHASTTLRVVHPDGVRSIDIRAERVESGPNMPVRLAGTVRDLTPSDVVGRRIRTIADAVGQIATPSADERQHGHTPQDAESLMAPLQRAIDNREFRLVYQPKISMITNRIAGFEALLRWDRPGYGTIPPNDFIPAAEANGLVLQIGEWVLDEGCGRLASWQQAYPMMTLTLAINVSARQFGPRLCGAVRHAISDSGIDPATLWLELTETMVMEDIEASLAVLDELRTIGVNISLDDFGTGHSSLAYLHRMPIDELKIDRSFVNGLGENSVDTAIVASVVNLAHAMGCDVTAEGVEHPHQLERLRNLGCDSAQGYLIARPLTPDDVDEHLAADVAGQRWPRLTGEGHTVEPALIEQSVLIVDDASDVRMLSMMTLTAAGFTIHEAGSAGAAIALAGRIRPDCVLLDIDMPDMSGIDVCKALRANPATAGCTIVMLTSHAEGTSKAEAFLLGADDYLVKPFAPRDLIARVSTALRRRQEMAGVNAPTDSALLEMVRTAQAQMGENADSLDTERFSERQLEIMRRLLLGERVPGIAKHLYVSQSTVRNHLSTIYRKLGVSSQEQLLLALRSAS